MSDRLDTSTSLPQGTPAIPAKDPSDEIRVSTLIGDRLCAQCGYNLTGQPVLREPHYQMLIARCPECAAVASIQEYPLLGRWANRWAAALAALWFLVIVALWLGTGLTIFGFGTGVGEISAERYSDFLNKKHQTWQVELASAANQPPPSPYSFTPGVNDFGTWWQQQDHVAIFQEAGGWANIVSWEALLLWLPLGLIAFALGCMWAVLLLGRGRLGLVAWSGIVMVAASAFSIFVLVDWINQEPNWHWHAAHKSISPIMLGITLGFGFLALIAGNLVGRPVVRGLLRLLLPPRLCAPLSGLWLADGLRPPGIGDVRWRQMRS